MKLKVLQPNFAKSLSYAIRFVSNKAQLPILSNIVLEASGSKLTLKSTNLEMSLSVDVGAAIDAPGQIALPARSLCDLIGNLPKSQILLEAEGESLKISTDNFEASMSGINTSDFPSIPQELNKSAQMEVERKDFVEAVSQVLFACSTDEGRPILTGVLCLFEKTNLTLVATDGFRLSKKTISLKTEITEPKKMILPRVSLMELLRLSQDTEKIYIEMRESENIAIFRIGDMFLSTRLIQGDFPNFEKIIPKQSAFVVSCEKEDLLRAIKTASVFARDQAFAGTLKVGEGSLLISSESSSSGAKQKIAIDAKTQGEGFEIIFNLRFIEEVLSNMHGDGIELHLNDNSSPGVFRDTKDPNYLHLIMPVRS